MCYLVAQLVAQLNLFLSREIRKDTDVDEQVFMYAEMSYLFSCLSLITREPGGSEMGDFPFAVGWTLDLLSHWLVLMSQQLKLSRESHVLQDWYERGWQHVSGSSRSWSLALWCYVSAEGKTVMAAVQVDASIYHSHLDLGQFRVYRIHSTLNSRAADLKETMKMAVCITCRCIMITREMRPAIEWEWEVINLLTLCIIVARYCSTIHPWM